MSVLPSGFARTEYEPREPIDLLVSMPGGRMVAAIRKDGRVTALRPDEAGEMHDQHVMNIDQGLLDGMPLVRAGGFPGRSLVLPQDRRLLVIEPSTGIVRGVRVSNMLEKTVQGASWIPSERDVLLLSYLVESGFEDSVEPPACRLATVTIGDTTASVSPDAEVESSLPPGDSWVLAETRDRVFVARGAEVLSYDLRLRRVTDSRTTAIKDAAEGGWSIRSLSFAPPGDIIVVGLGREAFRTDRLVAIRGDSSWASPRSVDLSAVLRADAQYGFGWAGNWLLIATRAGDEDVYALTRIVSDREDGIVATPPVVVAPWDDCRGWAWTSEPLAVYFLYPERVLRCEIPEP